MAFQKPIKSTFLYVQLLPVLVQLIMILQNLKPRNNYLFLEQLVLIWKIPKTSPTKYEI